MDSSSLWYKCLCPLGKLGLVVFNPFFFSNTFWMPLRQFSLIMTSFKEFWESIQWHGSTGNESRGSSTESKIFNTVDRTSLNSNVLRIPEISKYSLREYLLLASQWFSKVLIIAVKKFSVLKTCIRFWKIWL